MSDDSEHDSFPDATSFRDAVHFHLATDVDDNFGAHALTKSVASELLSQQKTGELLPELSAVEVHPQRRVHRGTALALQAPDHTISNR